jgi:hypothetical protein
MMENPRRRRRKKRTGQKEDAENNFDRAILNVYSIGKHVYVKSMKPRVMLPRFNFGPNVSEGKETRLRSHPTETGKCPPLNHPFTTMPLIFLAVR